MKPQTGFTLPHIDSLRQFLVEQNQREPQIQICKFLFSINYKSAWLRKYWQVGGVHRFQMFVFAFIFSPCGEDNLDC